MKRTLYFVLAAAALGLTACDEDYTDWAEPQVSAEGAATSFSGSASAASPSIDASSLGREVTLIKTSAPSGCRISFTRLMLNDEVGIPFSINEGGDVVVSADALSKAVQQYYQSLAPMKRDLSLSANYAMVNERGEASPVALAPVTIAYTPAALPANANEKAYYYVGGYNGWNLASPTPFESKGDGVYELTITIGDGEWFAFAPQSAVDAQDWNALFRAPANGCADQSGYLDNDPTTGWSFCCEKGGDYKFTLDMNNYTWSYTQALASNYYVTGNPNDWSDKVKNAAMYPQGGGIYTYTGAYKAAWDVKMWGEKNFGDWGNIWGAGNGDGAPSGTLIYGADAGAFQSPEAGYYTLTCNFNDKSYSWIRLENQTPKDYDVISLSGDFNSWGDTDLTRVSEFNSHNWYALDVNVDEVTYGVKFKANHAWDESWGGPNDLLYGVANGGDNLWVDPGVYDVYFNDITKEFLFVKK